MGIWYRAGTAAVSNGSPNVTGTGTVWSVYVRPGDRITFDDGGKWYEVLAIPSNTSITLATNFAEATIPGPGVAYAIDPSSYRHQIPSDILEQVRQLLSSQTDVFLTTGAPLDSLGDEGSLAFDPVAKVLYVKGATVWGAAVPFGDVGPTGPRGQPGGLLYLFDTGTANADPGAGKVRVNNAALASATALYISETDGLGVNVAAFLATLDDSTNTVRGMLTLASVATPANFRIYSVSGTLTDLGTFNALTIAHVAGNGTFANNEELAVQFAPAGNVGATGATGAPGGESVLMTFATATADADPGAGLVRLNNATLASVTQAFIDETTPAGVNIAAWLDTWDDSTNPTNKAVVTFSRANSPAANFARYYLTAVVSATGYRKLNITHILSAGSLDTTASNLLMSVERVGNQGLAGGLTDGDKGDITVTTGGTVFTINEDVVSNAKLANVPTGTIKGRATAGTGDPEDLTPAQARAVLGVREALSANRTYYVRTDGSDTNDGLSNTAGGAFLTIQKAIDTVASIDLRVFDVVIQVGAGTYTGGVNVSGPWLGSGTVTLTGDVATPTNVVISRTSANCITVEQGGNLRVGGFRLQTTTSGRGLNISTGGRVTISGNMSFHNCAGDHIVVANAGYLLISANYGISGSARAHINVLLNGLAEWYSRTVTITNAPVFAAAFVIASTGGAINTAGSTYSGSLTAKRYDLSLNSVLNTNGGGAAYFPGATVGTAKTGGQYA